MYWISTSRCDESILELHIDNNILTTGAEGAIMSAAGHKSERRLVPMVTYTDLFQFVIMLCAVITLVIYCTRKK